MAEEVEYTRRDRLWDVLCDVMAEAEASEEKHGNQDDLFDGTSRRYKFEADAARIVTQKKSRNEGGNGTITWSDILEEEFWEAMAETDSEALEKELVQAAAVCAKWVRALRIRREA